MRKQRTLPTTKEAQKWANALRSGIYKQGKHRLKNLDVYCCLGVLAEELAPNSTIVGNGFTLSDHEHLPLWARRINSTLEKKLGPSFVSLNDSMDYSFDEIADIIELVFVHKALD